MLCTNIWIDVNGPLTTHKGEISISNFCVMIFFLIRAVFLISLVSGTTPGSFGLLDIKPDSVTAAAMYSLGGPTGIRYDVNFQGCVRNFVIDGMKPVESYLQNDPQYTMYGSTATTSC